MSYTCLTDLVPISPIIVGQWGLFGFMRGFTLYSAFDFLVLVITLCDLSLEPMQVTITQASVH